MTAWSWLVPVASVALLGVALASGMSPILALVCTAALFGAVIAAVHHAEVVAHRVGEPYGTLILALSITAIEASLLLAILFTGGEKAAVVPRDTVYATVMIITTGVIGLCILLGGLAHHEQSFRVEGAGAGLAALITLATITLILPAFGYNLPGNVAKPVQLLVVALLSASLWAIFVFIQTVRHSDYFLPPIDARSLEAHAEPPSNREAWTSFALLIVSLVSVVGLAKLLSPVIEAIVKQAGLPEAVIGIVIALIVITPEAWAAARAARANRLQTSMNLAIGSALACIGLTVPVVALASVAFHIPIVLALEPIDIAVLSLTFLVSTVTLARGRTHVMQGAVHLVIFATFLLISLRP